MECLISFIGKIVLVTLNIAFMIVSLGLIIVGVILKFFPGTLLQFIFDGVRGVTQFSTPSAFGDLKTVPMLDDVGMALLFLGLALFCLSFIACCGACCEYKILLIVYIICMVALALVIAIVGGLILDRNSIFHSRIKEELRKQVNTAYMGPVSADPFTLSINILSYSLECCGITGTADFDTSSNAAWKNYTYNGNTFLIDVTPACCKQAILSLDTTFQCAMKLAGGSYNATITNTQGCYDAIQDLIQANLAYSILGLILILALLIVLVIFAACIVKSSKISPI